MAERLVGTLFGRRDDGAYPADDDMDEGEAVTDYDVAGDGHPDDDDVADHEMAGDGHLAEDEDDAAEDDGTTPEVPLRGIPGALWHRRARKVVAVIHGTGPVLHGRGRGMPFAGTALTSDAVGAAFRAAAQDDDVAAAVFRVESPGGSYVGSDVVRREVERFQASGRPVVVSMGSVAGSGGYFVALSADLIVAHAGTLTGSIGVLGGKQVLRGLLDKAGIRFGAVAEGENALMMSPSRPFTATERAKLERFLDRVYEDFVGKVAAARGMTRDEVHEVARGRVWTGADARSRGLVDEIGGFEQAVELAWAKAGLPAEQTPRTRLFPKVSLVERVRPAKSSEDRAAADLRAAFPAAAGSLWNGWGTPGGGWWGMPGWGVSGGWGALSMLAASLGLPPAGPLLMPPIGQVT
jgi:protease-4